MYTNRRSGKGRVIRINLAHFPKLMVYYKSHLGYNSADELSSEKGPIG